MRPKDYLKEPYSRILIPADGSYHAEIMEFPGCFAQGDTPEEAYRNLERTAEAWIEACLASGQAIPEPFVSVDYSGRIVLRLPKSIHRLAAQASERDGTSLNQFLVSAISFRVGAEDMIGALEQRLSRSARKVLQVVTEAATLQKTTFSNVEIIGDMQIPKFDRTASTTENGVFN